MIETIGKIVCLYYGFKVVYWVVKMLTTFGPHVKPVDFGKYGAWTIVTGGTDGIGREYVRQLASLGKGSTRIYPLVFIRFLITKQIKRTLTERTKYNRTWSKSTKT